MVSSVKEIWSTSRAVLGSEDALYLERNGWEPFAAVPVESPKPEVLPGQTLNQILARREGEHEIVVLYRKRVQV